MKASEIRNIEAEAGVIASILVKPEYVLLSDGVLKPNHFTDNDNAYIYYAVGSLVSSGVTQVDPYNIMNILSAVKGTQHVVDGEVPVLTISVLQELFDNAIYIARKSPEDYMVLVRSVADAAFRRKTYNKLLECEHLCYDGTDTDIRAKIQNAIDDVLLEFSSVTEVPRYKDVVDEYWQSILAKQNPDNVGVIPFPFPTLNEYVMIERSELIVLGATAKMGKSMFLLNCAVDLLKRGCKVFYIDSELNSELFTCRLLSHLTGIEFKRIRHGNYGREENEEIQKAIAWLKTRTFRHLYIPEMDENTIYTAVKQLHHAGEVDVLIFDYFKGSKETDAFASYQSLGGLVDRTLFTINLLNCWKTLRVI